MPRPARRVVMLRGRALPDADERDDRRDPDDRRRASSGRRAGGSCGAARGRAGAARAHAHAAIRPSRMWTWRPAAAATSASWVMRTIVRPAAWSSRRTARTSRPDALSRLPVGSSARISAGSVTSARATATRCCWPPDSSLGSWSRRSPSPRRSSAAVRPARSARARPTPWYRSGVATFSSADRPRQQVVRLEDEADRPAAEAGEPVVVELGDGRPGEAVDARPSAGRGSRGCSSSCSCPSPTGRRSRRTRPRRPSADVLQGVDLERVPSRRSG